MSLDLKKYEKCDIICPNKRGILMEEKDKIKILKEAEQAIKMCKVISNKSFKDFNRYWIRQDKAFKNIANVTVFQMRY